MKAFLVKKDPSYSTTLVDGKRLETSTVPVMIVEGRNDIGELFLHTSTSMVFHGEVDMTNIAIRIYTTVD